MVFYFLFFIILWIIFINNMVLIHPSVTGHSPSKIDEMSCMSRITWDDWWNGWGNMSHWRKNNTDFSAQKKRFRSKISTMQWNLWVFTLCAVWVFAFFWNVSHFVDASCFLQHVMLVLFNIQLSKGLQVSSILCIPLLCYLFIMSLVCSYLCWGLPC